MIATGNRHAEREISGLVLEWLALYRAVLPKATLAECRAFLFNMDPTQPPYSNSQVHRAEKLLDLKRKAASTTADFATLPINMLKRELYWTMPPPLGMVGVAVADILDIDEAGFKNPLITNAILNAGHRYVFRAPYWPVDGVVGMCSMLFKLR